MRQQWQTVWWPNIYEVGSGLNYTTSRGFPADLSIFCGAISANCLDLLDKYPITSLSLRFCQYCLGGMLDKVDSDGWRRVKTLDLRCNSPEEYTHSRLFALCKGKTVVGFPSYGDSQVWPLSLGGTAYLLRRLRKQGLKMVSCSSDHLVHQAADQIGILWLEEDKDLPLLLK